MRQLINDIGPFAGIAALLGVAVLALLYFSHARDVRRLREWAGRAPELPDEELATVAVRGTERAEQLSELEQRRRAEEERRRAEQEAAAEREARRQRRAAGEPDTPRFAALRAAPRRRLTEPRYLALVIAGVVVLGAAVAVGALALLGDGDGGPAAAEKAAPKSEIEVAVLNGTAVTGLAASFADDVEQRGYNLGAVTNSQSGFERSVVMYQRGFKPEARMVSRDVRINRLQLMTPEVAAPSAGATVAVVVGEDRAT